MKLFLCAVVAATLLFTIPNAHALFGHVAAERERRLYVERKLDQREHTNERLHITISILSAGVVVALLIGAAAGSKTRRDAQQP